MNRIIVTSINLDDFKAQVGSHLNEGWHVVHLAAATDSVVWTKPGSESLSSRDIIVPNNAFIAILERPK